MTPLHVDICVLGAGAGGLSVAAGAAMLGASAALVEKGKMGGDCLNYGCVPSKALLAAGHAADALRRAGRFGADGGPVSIDPVRVYAHVHGTIAGIAPIDSQERFEGLGVKVFRGTGRFTGPGEVAVDGTRITARRFVVATGSSPLVPPIPGLADVPYLTNESVFDLKDLPKHLIIIGGGPIGAELAQAHRHLGCAVTVVEADRVMPRDDPELVGFVRARLCADGIALLEGAKVVRVESAAGGPAVIAEIGGGERRIEGSHLLVATGRKANLDGLDLDKAGVETTRTGIKVDARLRTTNRKIFAIGDVAGGLQFTHVAGYHASVVIRNALFRLPAKADHAAVPWVTYTAPELAAVGLGEADALTRYGRDLRVLRWPFAENDRARAEGETDGLIKALATRKGRVLGAAIVGPQAGELIQVWTLALAQKLKIGAMATAIAPYPTLGEASKRAAGSFYTPTLFSNRTRRLVRFLARFG